MTFLTVNYCKGISTIIQLQNNANGVLRIYHLSESSVIGALKEIKFSLCMSISFSTNMNEIFKSSKIQIKILKNAKWRRRAFYFCS